MTKLIFEYFDRLNPTVDILKHGTRPVVIGIFVRSNIAIGIPTYHNFAWYNTL